MPISTSWACRLLDISSFLANDAGSWRVGLFTNSPTLLPSTVLADFVEPTFSGYARLPIPSWPTATINGADQAESAGLTSMTFQPTSPTSLPQTVNGFFCEDGAGNYLFGDYFALPFTFVDPSYSYDLLNDFKVGALA